MNPHTLFPSTPSIKQEGHVVLQGQKQALGAGADFQGFLVYPLVMEEMRKMRPQQANRPCQGPGTS